MALQMLVEGASMRSTSRVLRVSTQTLAKLLVDAGRVCDTYHHEHVRGLTTQRVQCDEVWAFCYAKRNNANDAQGVIDVAGDAWTWTALDADTRLLITFLVSPERDTDEATRFMGDLRGRIASERVQISTDGYIPYVEAVDRVFGCEADFAQVHGVPPRRTPLSGDPDLDHVNTSYVERHNLTIRMGMRRFTRRTNAFSKKFENHYYAQALFFTYYNWVRPHETLRQTPAQAAGLSRDAFSMEWVVAMIDAATPAPRRR